MSDNSEQRREDVGASNEVVRYVVVENTPGYLPEEDEPFVSEDPEAARSYLKERVEEYCDHLCEGYDYREGYEPTVYWSEDLTFAHVNDPERSRDLGRAFEILTLEDGDDA